MPPIHHPLNTSARPEALRFAPPAQHQSQQQPSLVIAGSALPAWCSASFDPEEGDGEPLFAAEQATITPPWGQRGQAVAVPQQAATVPPWGQGAHNFGGKGPTRSQEAEAEAAPKAQEAAQEELHNNAFRVQPQGFTQHAQQVPPQPGDSWLLNAYLDVRSQGGLSGYGPSFASSQSPANLGGCWGECWYMDTSEWKGLWIRINSATGITIIVFLYCSFHSPHVHC